MQKAYRNLVEYALGQSLVVSVFDGEEWAVKKSKDAKAIFDAIESVEEANIVIRGREFRTASVLVSAYGLGPDETVIDYTDNEWMEEWWQQYKKQIAA
jgi:hypothetical protein